MIRYFKSILIFSFFSILISNIILVPQDYTDIQSAINISMENDTIMVNRYDPPWRLPFLRRNEILVQIK